MRDPFEEVTPAEEIDPWQALTTELFRSMTWDMIGPYKMQSDPIGFGHNPASPDVLEAEAKEMWTRKHSLTPFGWDFPLLCYMASEAASMAILNSEEKLKGLSDDEKNTFRMNNVRLGTAIAESVVSHMLQKGLITYGDRSEFLGEQA